MVRIANVSKSVKLVQKFHISSILGEANVLRIKNDIMGTQQRAPNFKANACSISCICQNTLIHNSMRPRVICPRGQQK